LFQTYKHTTLIRAATKFPQLLNKLTRKYNIQEVYMLLPHVIKMILTKSRILSEVLLLYKRPRTHIKWGQCSSHLRSSQQSRYVVTKRDVKKLQWHSLVWRSKLITTEDTQIHVRVRGHRFR